SGLAAAYELTSEPGWQSLYDVTVYQMGWRLGGKTATGRGPCDRVEEHGLHVLMGWYWNTFRMLRETFAERRAAGLDPSSPFHDVEQAFDPTNALLLPEYSPAHGRWLNWPVIFPTNDARPGSPPLSMWQVMIQALKTGVSVLRSAYRDAIPGGQPDGGTGGVCG